MSIHVDLGKLTQDQVGALLIECLELLPEAVLREALRDASADTVETLSQVAQDIVIENEER